jgi:hypothetical protein
MVALNKFTGVARRGAYGSLSLGAWAERGTISLSRNGHYFSSSVHPTSLPWSAGRSRSRTCKWRRVSVNITLFKYRIGRERGFQRCR